MNSNDLCGSASLHIIKHSHLSSYLPLKIIAFIFMIILEAYLTSLPARRKKNKWGGGVVILLYLWEYNPLLQVDATPVNISDSHSCLHLT